MDAAGNLLGGLLGGDLRTLIGLPIAGVMLCYLSKPSVRAFFAAVRR